MFDFRYHALSLAAVLFALALGVVIGVAIGDSNLVSSAKSGIVANLRSEVSQAHQQAGHLHERLAAEETFATGLYPLSVHELLGGRTIGVVFLGGSSDTVNTLVRAAVAQAGGQVTTVVAVREPLDLSEISHQVAGTHYAPLATSAGLVDSFGELIGRQLVSGGPRVGRELISRVRAGLLSAFDGQLTSLEGVVVMRAEPSGMSARAKRSRQCLRVGLARRHRCRRRARGGRRADQHQPFQTPWYTEKGISSVDDLDQLAGQAALDYALAGSHGTFGVKSTAESLLPSAGRQRHEQRSALTGARRSDAAPDGCTLGWLPRADDAWRVRSPLISTHARPAVRDRTRERRDTRAAAPTGLARRWAYPRELPPARAAIPVRRAHACGRTGGADPVDAAARSLHPRRYFTLRCARSPCMRSACSPSG